jgi:hypothetical protein
MARGHGLTRVELNSAGVAELLKSPEVQADLRRRGDAIALVAGPGHEVSLHVESRRASVIVFTESPEAMAAEAEDRNLTRSLDAGR